MKTNPLILSSSLFTASLCSAAITPIDSLSSYDNGTGTGWTGIGYADPSLADPGGDQQTGGVEGDLVGSAIIPFFYTAFDNNGTTGNLRDGTISFRTRHGGDSNPAGFGGALSIGIDANGDGHPALNSAQFTPPLHKSMEQTTTTEMSSPTILELESLSM